MVFQNGTWSIGKILNFVGGSTAEILFPDGSKTKCSVLNLRGHKGRVESGNYDELGIPDVISQ